MQAVTFPSSMVDRIVPTTDAGLRERVFAALGVWDDAPAPAEPFSMWAIEDRFAAGRPTWEAGGAIFTDEVDRYEQLKVRLLNGTHSLIAYLGALSGAATIPEAIALGNIEESARAVLQREYEPSVEVPSGLDVRDYEAQLFERWGNTALGHRTTQVGTDGSVKLRQRIPEPVARALDDGEMPHLIALTVAAYLCCLAPLPGFSPGPFADAMTDTARGRLAEIAGTSSNGTDVAYRVIGDLELFGHELSTRATFISRVGELVDIIVRRGCRAAIADALDASADASTPRRLDSPHRNDAQRGAEMKTLAIHGKEDIRWEDRPAPEPGDGEVRLRVKYVGICGSDLHYYFHGANGEYTIREPLTPGHELSAIVDLDPSGRLAARHRGDRASRSLRRSELRASRTDRTCRPGGDYLGSAAATPHRQGGASEFLLVEDHMIRVLPATLPLERASLAEPLAVALHAVGLAGDVTGKRVLVIGSGPIGLLVIAAARRAGATIVGASDLRPEPLQRAAALGATELILVGQDTIADESYDVVFECSGVGVSLTQAVRAARRAGTVVQVGMLPNADIGVNLAPMLAKELTIRGAFRFSTEIDDAIAMLAESDALDSVISHVIPAASAVEAFTVARDSSASAKVLLSL